MDRHEVFYKSAGAHATCLFFLFQMVTCMQRIDMRCKSCGKLLCKTDGNTEIVCPRCGSLNRYDPRTNTIDCEPKRNRQMRTSSSGVTFR